MKFSLFALIKFGKEEHIKFLLDSGQVFMNHITTFIKIEDRKLRGDEHESLVKVEPIQNLELFIEDRLIATADIGVLRFKKNHPIGNIYSMYALSRINDLSKIKIDARCKEFGDSCLIILDVKEFIHRFEKAAASLNENLIYAPVKYEEYESYSGKWSLFKKYNQYDYQKEFRFVIKQNNYIGPIVLELGALYDIAVMLPSEDIDNLVVKAS